MRDLLIIAALVGVYIYADKRKISAQAAPIADGTNSQPVGWNPGVKPTLEPQTYGGMPIRVSKADYARGIRPWPYQICTNSPIGMSTCRPVSKEEYERWQQEQRYCDSHPNDVPRCILPV